MNKTLRIQKDQILSYATYGNENDFPVLIQHGLIASIKDIDLFTPLLDLGTRVICIARPGYGDSSPHAMKNVAEWGNIVSALVQELGLAQFDVLGISSGAPYSYSIGFQMPEKTRNIFILSGIPALYDDAVLAHWPYNVTKNARIEEMQKLAHELFFSDLSPHDLEDNDVKDSLRNDCFGLALDLRIRFLDWGFKLQEVKPQVIMRHSHADQAVPFITAETTSKMLPNCRLDVRKSDAHFSSEIMADFIHTIMAEHYL